MKYSTVLCVPMDRIVPNASKGLLFLTLHRAKVVLISCKDAYFVAIEVTAHHASRIIFWFTARANHVPPLLKVVTFVNRRTSV